MRHLHLITFAFCLFEFLFIWRFLTNNQVGYWCKVAFVFLTRESQNLKMAQVEALYLAAMKYISVNQPTNWYFLPTMLRAYQPLFLPLNSLSGRITNAINSSIVLFYHFCLIKLQFLQRKCLLTYTVPCCIFVSRFIYYIWSFSFSFSLISSLKMRKWQYQNSKSVSSKSKCFIAKMHGFNQVILN